MLPERNHITFTPIDDFVDKIYLPDLDRVAMGKPNGFWYAYKDEWFNFWHNDNPENIYIYEVIINPDNFTTLDQPNKLKVLRISTFNELEAFTEKYSFGSLYSNEKIGIFFFGTESVPDILLKIYKDHISWKDVMENYAGIEIIPYIYKARFKYKWYYTWDIASGCIWNTKIIDELNLMIYH